MEQTKQLGQDKLQSHVISYLRFWLIIGVVLIHSSPDKVVIGGADIVDGHNFEIYNTFRYFISEVVARIAVPAFFFISGFLFFYKTESFDCDTYFQKIKKRSRTLLIPYLFWNLVVVLLFYLTQTFLSGLTSGENLLIKEYTWINWLKAFWDGNKIGEDMPINYPLWFVRDLMVVIVISPIVYFCVKRLKIIFVVILGLLWFSGIWFTIPGLSITALFFFSYGAYYSINKKNFVESYNRYFPYSFWVYIIIAIFDLLTRQYDWHIYVPQMGILVGLIAFVSLVAYGIEKQKLHTNPFLANSSFFIYVYHGMPLAFLIKFSVKVLLPQTDAGLIMLYLVCPLITILAGLGIYSVLIKYFPKFTAIITGGR